MKTIQNTVLAKQNTPKMNSRKIKLALTVGLMNKNSGGNTLGFMKEMMLGFNEVGSFIGLRKIKKSKLNRNHVQQTYAIQFENCILNVDLISNPRTKNQFVQRFQLR